MRLSASCLIRTGSAPRRIHRIHDLPAKGMHVSERIRRSGTLIHESLPLLHACEARRTRSLLVAEMWKGDAVRGSGGSTDCSRGAQGAALARCVVLPFREDTHIVSRALCGVSDIARVNAQPSLHAASQNHTPTCTAAVYEPSRSHSNRCCHDRRLSRAMTRDVAFRTAQTVFASHAARRARPLRGWSRSAARAAHPCSSGSRCATSRAPGSAPRGAAHRRGSRPPGRARPRSPAPARTWEYAARVSGRACAQCRRRCRAPARR